MVPDILRVITVILAGIGAFSLGFHVIGPALLGG